MVKVFVPAVAVSIGDPLGTEPVQDATPDPSPSSHV